MAQSRRKAATRTAKPRRSRRSAAGKTSAKTSAPLVPQPHGGALQVGNPGNVGGPGRPPSAIREDLRGDFDERRRVLREIADANLPIREKCPACGHEPKPTTTELVAVRDRVRAIDIMGKYGLGTVRELSVDHVKSRLEEMYRLLAVELDAKTFQRIDQRMAEIWR